MKLVYRSLGYWAIQLSFLGFTFLWALYRSGVAISPSVPQIVEAAAVWPRYLDEPFAAYLSDSPIGLLAINWFKLESQSYLMLCTGFSILVVGMFANWARLEASNQSSRAMRFVFLAPFVAVLFTWIGQYDVFTLLLWVFFFYAWRQGSRSLILVVGIPLGFQHFEHASLGIAALVLCWLAVRGDLGDKIRERNPLWIFPGVLLGKIVLLTVHALSEGSPSARASWLETYFDDWLKTAINSGPILLWSLFAGSWALVIAYLIGTPTKRMKLLLVSAFLVGILGTLLSGDRPRVFVLVMAPALLLLTVAYLRSGRTSNREMQLVELLLWLGVPVSLWGAKVVYSGARDQFLISLQRLSSG